MELKAKFIWVQKKKKNIFLKDGAGIIVYWIRPLPVMPACHIRSLV